MVADLVPDSRQQQHMRQAPYATSYPEAPVRQHPRPAFKPEEGESGRADWIALGKAVLIAVVVVAVLGTMLTR